MATDVFKLTVAGNSGNIYTRHSLPYQRHLYLHAETTLPHVRKTRRERRPQHTICSARESRLLARFLITSPFPCLADQRRLCFRPVSSPRRHEKRCMGDSCLGPYAREPAILLHLQPGSCLAILALYTSVVYRSSAEHDNRYSHVLSRPTLGAVSCHAAPIHPAGKRQCVRAARGDE